MKPSSDTALLIYQPSLFVVSDLHFHHPDYFFNMTYGVLLRCFLFWLKILCKKCLIIVLYHPDTLTSMAMMHAQTEVTDFLTFWCNLETSMQSTVWHESLWKWLHLSSSLAAGLLHRYLPSNQTAPVEFTSVVNIISFQMWKTFSLRGVWYSKWNSRWQPLVYLWLVVCLVQSQPGRHLQWTACCHSGS